jgi:hypothetical protein
MRHRTKIASPCCICKTRPLVQYGRCWVCFKQMAPNLLCRLKKMSRKERQVEIAKTAPAQFEHWTYEPSPEQVEDLIKKHGTQEENNNV